MKDDRSTGAQKQETRQNTSVFRQKTLDRIASPEQLTDYLCVTNPGFWTILLAVILLFVGLCAWATVGTLETQAPVKVIVEEHIAQVVPVNAERLSEGMPLRIAAQEYTIASTGTDAYGRLFGVAEVGLPDGVYDGTVALEQTRPIDFLLEREQ